MKLIFLLLLICTMQTFATDILSQKPGVKLAHKEANLQQVLDEIEKQTNLRFLYQNETVKDKLVELNLNNKSWYEILEQIKEASDVNYRILEDNLVVLTPVKKQQPQTVTGTVTDENGEPLPGVSVALKGTTRGAITSVEGEYSIEVDDPQTSVLVFSFLGMRTQEIPVGGNTSIDVVMLEETIGLDEVVVIGYGTMKKSDLTGAVTSISDEEIANRTNASIDQILQGRAAGVMVSTLSGEPGGAMNIRIRGISSFTNTSEPLYVIDGVPFLVNEDYALTPGFQKSNPLASINPSDIESIEILKDASASSIYGSRGSNGVILITTKKGAGAPKVTFEMSYTSQELVKKMDMASGPELIGLIDEFRAGLGEDPIFDGRDLYHPRKEDAGSYDYQDLLFQRAPLLKTNLSVRGSTDQTQYYISANYFNQEGIIIESGFERYSIRLNLDQKIGKRFKIRANSFYSKTENTKMPTGSQNGLMENILTFPSFLPVYDDDGNYVDNTVFAESPRPNPVSIAKEVSTVEKTDRSMTSLFGEYQILDGLTFSFTGSYDGAFQRRDVFQNPEYFPATVYGGTASLTNQKIINLIFNSYLTYDRMFLDKFNITAMAGYEIQDYTVEGSSLGGRGFSSPSLGIWGMSTAITEHRNISTNKSKKNMAGYFGRLNIDFLEKYLFTFNIRADGSSVFSEDNKWGIFPSGAFAWKLDQEPFIKNLDLFSNLKLRISYGATGNGEIPLYQSQALWSINSNAPSYEATGTMRPVFGGNEEGDVVDAAYISRIANPDLKWEKTVQFDLGVDMGFYNNRIQFTGDYYHKSTIDAIIPRAIPKTSGFDMAYMNIGSLLNKGLELNITAFPISGNFSWEVNANATFMNQTPSDLSDNDYLFVSQLGGRNSQLGLRMEVGKPAGLLWGYVYDGVWSDQDEINNRTTVTSGIIGSYKGVDINGDNLVDGNDMTCVGRSLPATIFGFSSRFSYKNIALSFHLQGSYGNDNYIDFWNNLLGMDVTYPTNVLKEYLDDYWTPANPDAKYAGISGATGSTLKPWETNSNSVFDASYIRFKTITLSYSLNTQSLKVIDSAMFYVTGGNLLTISKYPGYNPDIASLGMQAFNAGYDNSAYPIAKTVTLGLNISF